MSIVVSYLIPSYNHEKFLSLTLASIEQDISLLKVAAEVIIIDDGSTDNSVHLIRQWIHLHQEQFNIVFISQSNKGLPVVLNALIASAQGTYLRLCASDDILIAGSTQILLNQFSINPLLVCVVGDGSVIDAEGAIIHKSSIAYHGGVIKRLKNSRQQEKELITHWCIAGPCHLIKKNHYQQLTYNEQLTIDDFDLFLSLLMIPGALFFLESTVCLYRFHSNNTSKTNDVTRRIVNIKSFRCIIDKYLNQRCFVNDLRPLRYQSTAKIYFLQKKYFNSFFYLCLSLFFKMKSELIC